MVLILFHYLIISSSAKHSDLAENSPEAACKSNDAANMALSIS